MSCPVSSFGRHGGVSRQCPDARSCYTACQLRRSDPKQGSAKAEAVDGDRNAAATLPISPQKAEPTHSTCATAHGVTLEAVGPVAELAGDALRGKIVLERARYGRLCAQSRKGQMQYCSPHLGANSLPLVTLSEPRTGAHLAKNRKITCAEGLLPNDDTRVKDREVERPVVRGPVAQPRPVMLDHTSSDLGRRPVGPRHKKRHRARRMNAICRESRKGTKLLGRRQAKFQPRRHQAQPNQRKVVDKHAFILATARLPVTPFRECSIR